MTPTNKVREAVERVSAFAEGLKTTTEIAQRNPEREGVTPRVAHNIELAGALRTLISAAQAPAGPEDGKAVAWRVKDFADGWFFYGQDQWMEASRAEDDGFLVEPLYAGPPSPPPADSVGELVEAAKDLIASMSASYKARNGRVMGIQADDGEMCWIIHSDRIGALGAALSTFERSAAQGQGDAE